MMCAVPTLDEFLAAMDVEHAKLQREIDAVGYPQVPPPPLRHQGHWDHVAGMTPLNGLMSITWTRCPEVS